MNWLIRQIFGHKGEQVAIAHIATIMLAYLHTNPSASKAVAVSYAEQQLGNVIQLAIKGWPPVISSVVELALNEVADSLLSQGYDAATVALQKAAADTSATGQSAAPAASGA
jgi:hypothetical protein